jgi:hypothetical protein
MNKHGHAVSSRLEVAAAASDERACDGGRSGDGQDFAPMREGDLAAFYRQFLRVRAEPVFIDIFKPIPYQSAAQFAEYFAVEKRPLWMMGRPKSPTAYFGLHYMLHQHDLANLDFVYFSAYPSPGSDAAHSFWRYVRGCMVERGLTRVQSFVIESSVEKIRLLESFGFRQEGLLREHYFHNGKMHDIVVHAWMAEGRHG